MKREKDGIVHRFLAFPGVSLSFYDLRATEWAEEEIDEKRMVIEINHCELGSYTCTFRNGSSILFQEGNLSFSSMTERKVTEKFPEEIYSGITILIDIEEARKEFFPLLKEFGVDAEFLVNLWKNGLPCRIIRETGRLRELFRGLYESEDILSTGMVRVKLAEFAVLVEELGRSGQKVWQDLEDVGAQKLEQIRESLENSFEREISLEMLAAEQQVSVSWIQKNFRKFYGKTPGQYRKEMRMRYAARCLLETEESIAAIGAKAGYANPSKFSAAFQSVMQSPPSVYRRGNVNL